jgi:hypothetical protein
LTGILFAKITPRRQRTAVEPFSSMSKNLNLFRKMKEMAAQQWELLIEDQTDAFLSLYDKREHLQTEVSENEMKYKALLEKDHPAERDRRVHDISLKVADVIQSIQEIDRKIEEFVTRKRAEMLLEIRDLRQGQKALKGYGTYPQRLPQFIDREG